MARMLSWRVVRRLMVMAAIVALPVTGYAQEAVVSGTVTDSTGGVLPGVTLTALHEASGNTFLTVTDERGGYRLPVRVGVYRITAELAGFATVNRTVELAVGQTAIANFQMSAGGVQETITVTGEAPLVDTTSAKMGGNIDPRQMQQLPLNGRNWMDLTLMAPGSRMNAVVDNPTVGGGTNGNFSINIDGQSVSQQMFNTFGQARFSRDAIAEFEVTTRFDATQGRSSGVQVNAITKSGTNTLAGSYSGYFRDNKFNAADFIQKRVLPYSNQQMAWTVGGPIRRDRIHFFANFDYTREPQTYTYSSPYPSFNIDQVFRKDERKGGLRLDYQFSPQIHLAVRGNKSWATEPVNAGGASNHPSAVVITDRNANNLYLTLTQVLSNRAVNEIKGGYAGFLWTREPLVKGWCCHPFGLTEGTPIITLQGYTIGQAHNNSPQRWVQDPYSIRDDFTVSFTKGGRHTVKVGSEYVFQKLNIFVCNRCMGEIDAGGGPRPANLEQLFPVWNDVNTWNIAALSPIVRSYRVGLGQMKIWDPRHYYSGWAQDDWVPTPSLTLNLGVRYDFAAGKELDTDFQPFYGPGRPADKNNFGPRLGFAYSLTDRTVVRGGFGKYFAAANDNEGPWTMLFAGEIHPQVFNDFTRPDWAAKPFNGPIPTYEQAVALWQAGAGVNRFVSILAPPDPWDAYSYQGSIGAQRQVGTTMSVEADYVYTASRGVSTGTNINLSYNPATGYNYPFRDRSKHPIAGWDEVTMRLRTNESNYHGLQMAFSKRMSNRWQASATYLFAHQYDRQVPPTRPGCKEVTTVSASGAFVCDVPIQLHPTLRDEWYLNNDQVHRLTFNGIWDVGYGFSLSGLYFFGDNGFATAAAGADVLETGSFTGRVRADRTIIPRQGINFPNLHRVDLRLQRRFRLSSRVGIDGILELFNLFNHENYGTFVTNERTVAQSNGRLRLGSPSFNDNLAYQPRIMQLAFRATF